MLHCTAPSPFLLNKKYRYLVHIYCYRKNQIDFKDHVINVRVTCDIVDRLELDGRQSHSWKDPDKCKSKLNVPLEAKFL